MPLLRSRRAVQRKTFRVFVRFWAAMAIVTMTFALAVAGHYICGWW